MPRLMLCICAFTACAVSFGKSDELDERPHALFLTAARKSLVLVSSAIPWRLYADTADSRRLGARLMCGSEFNVAAFSHPTLNRQPLDTHIGMRSAFAVLLGRVMPFWMAGSTLLNLVLVLPFAHLTGTAWTLTTTSAAIQVLAVIFSLIGPVPINNRIKTWTPDSLPTDWQAQERRWDAYHWVRTIGLIVAFALLLCSVAIQ